VEIGLVAPARICQGGRAFIPVQVAGRAPVDAAGMTGRVEDLIASALRRL
jgi:hypothetical protein